MGERTDEIDRGEIEGEDLDRAGAEERRLDRAGADRAGGPGQPGGPDQGSAGRGDPGQAGDLGPERMAQLLDLARGAVVAAAGRRVVPRLEPADAPWAVAPADAFVTLRERDDRLRGCMGTLGANRPLGEAVARAARMAAIDDPRFPPVVTAELPGLQLEVSVLGPTSPLADVAAFVPGRDGIVVEARGRRALLLPQVATELDWGAEEMLAAACEKAGLRRDTWRDPATRLSTFRVERTSGPAVAPRTRPHPATARRTATAG